MCVPAYMYARVCLCASVYVKNPQIAPHNLKIVEIPKICRTHNIHIARRRGEGRGGMDGGREGEGREGSGPKIAL